MGNPLRVFRGMEPILQSISPPPDWDSADGTFNHIFCNSIEVAEPPGPAELPALVITEYQNSPTDFARMDIEAQVGGPFLIATDTQPTSVMRDIQIHPNRDLILNADRNAFLDAGGSITLETFAASPIILGTNSIPRWQVDPNGHILPIANSTYDIGSATLNARNMWSNEFTATGTPTPTGIGNTVQYSGHLVQGNGAAATALPVLRGTAAEGPTGSAGVGWLVLGTTTVNIYIPYYV
jgi:hypothetical protein